MNELMFTGLQMVGSSVMCLAAGIGIGAVGLRIVDRAKLPDCASCGDGEEVDCPSCWPRTGRSSSSLK